MKYKLQIEKLKQLKMEENILSKENAIILEDALTWLRDEKRIIDIARPLSLNGLELAKYINEYNNKKEGEAMGFALGFAHFLLCFYNTSEEGMSLCWHDVDNKTKHDTKEVFEIYLKTLK